MSKTFDRRIAVACVTLVLLSLCRNGSAQINSWTNPTSANWEGPYWSLGVLPGSTQTVMITNAGYKAVGIFPSTPTNYPASMTVSNLTVSAPANALSTLLLNYFGTGTPLEVLDGCTIGTNGSIVNLHSAFEVQTNLTILNGGQYVEQGGTTVTTNANTYVLDGGSVNLTNADFKLGQLVLGSFNNFSDTSMVSQAGGQTDCQLTILGGSYTVSNGTFSGACSLGGQFTQYGGTNEASISIGGLAEFGTGGGAYNLFQGTVVCPSIKIAPYTPADGGFNQVGGTVVTATISMGPGNGRYSLTNGTLLVGGIGVNNSFFEQEDSQVSTTNLGVYGSLTEDSYGDSVPNPANYYLDSGELSCASLALGEFGFFRQSGGTNTVAGTLSLSTSEYDLSSGVLLTSNTTILPGDLGTYDVAGMDSVFAQVGGQQWVTNTLSNLDTCLLWGGSLYASNIVNEGFLSVSNPAVILNPGLFQCAGTLQLFGGTSESLGQLQLAGNSSIALMPGTHTLGFLNSSALAWSNRCWLVVSNWNGLTNGGGSDQLMFGNDSGGLTPAQLRQLVFVNPAGFPPGNYAANILPSGEVIPLPNPLFSWQTIHGQLVMSWAGQATLQSSTNVLGPYVDDSNASSPYTNSSGPDRFFRLRR